MTSLFGNMRTTIQLTVVIAFVFATALTASLAIGLQYYFGQSMAKTVAADLYETGSSGIASELRSVARINANVIDLLADNPVLADPSQGEAHLEIFTQVLLKNPLYYGIYLGGADGSFFEVINLDTSDNARKKLQAHPHDRWLTISMESGANGPQRHYRYLDENLQTRLSRAEPTDYEVRSRPWYASAMASDAVQMTEPYIFAQLGAPGQTLSKRLKHSDTVVAIDMTLATISEFLKGHKISKHGDVYLFNASGDVIASSHDRQKQESELPVPDLALTEEEQKFVAAQPVLRVSNELNWPPFDYAQAGQPDGYSVDVIKLIAKMTGLKISFSNGFTWPELVALFEEGEIDVLQSVIATETNQSLGLFGNGYVKVPYALTTRTITGPINSMEDLNGKRLAIPAGWSTIPIVRARFPQIDIVEAASTLNAMEMVVAGSAAAALDTEAIMRFLERTYSLTGLQFHDESILGENQLPDTLHIVVASDRPQLRQLIDKAIAALGEEQLEYLSEKWLQDDAGINPTPSPVRRLSRLRPTRRYRASSSKHR